MPDCCRKYREEKLRKSSHIRSDSLRSIPAPASEIPLAPGFRTSRWISSGLCRIAAVNIGKKNSERAVISNMRRLHMWIGAFAVLPFLAHGGVPQEQRTRIQHLEKAVLAPC